MGHCAFGAAAATIRSTPFYTPVLLSRRICAFTYSLISQVMRSSLQTNPNNPRWWIILSVPRWWIILSVHHVKFCLVVRWDNRTLTGVGPSQQLSNNRSQKRLGRRAFRFLGSNPCFSLLSKYLFLKQFLCSLSFFTFCPPFNFMYCSVLWVAGEVRGLPSGASSFPPLWNLGTELRLT